MGLGTVVDEFGTPDMVSSATQAEVASGRRGHLRAQIIATPVARYHDVACDDEHVGTPPTDLPMARMVGCKSVDRDGLIVGVGAAI